MKKNKTIINYPLSILSLTCIIFAIFTFVLNIFLSVKRVVLEVWANLLIFCVILIVSAIIVLSKKLVIKSFVLKASTIIFSILSISLNITLAIVAKLNMWHWYTVVLIAAYSLAVTFMLKYLRLNSYLLRAFIYYCVSIVSFYLLTNVIGGYKAGNTNILLFGIFTLAYIIASIVFFYIKRSFFKFENEEQEYKKQFD